MANSDELRLAELLCARLCHDLSGPIGGAAAGIELLEGEDGAADSETLALVGASIGSAARHLRFLRAAFGSGKETMAAAELRALVTGFLASPSGSPARVELDWQADAPEHCERRAAKLLLNLVLAGRDLMPRGGRLSVRFRASPPSAEVVAEGAGLSAAEVAAGVAAPTAAGLSTRAAQAFYAARLAAELGLVLEIGDRGETVTLAAHPAQ